MSAFSTDCKWIWANRNQNEINQYVSFRKTFVCDRNPRKAQVLISVDSDYSLWINGREVYGRQFPSYPRYRTYNVHDVADWLHKGENSMCVLGYYRGEDSSDYRKGKPGLLLQLDAGNDRIVTDSSWLCRSCPAFESGEQVHKTTPQMGFNVHYDARLDDGWKQPDYSPGSDWTPAEEIAGPTDGYWIDLRERPLPYVTRDSFQPAALLSRGDVMRPAEDAWLVSTMESRFLPEGDLKDVRAGNLSTAQWMAIDYKRVSRYDGDPFAPVTISPPSKKNGGACLVYDLGMESVGLLRFICEAPAGTVLEIAHGEHLDDLGVRMFVGPRHFADRYVCKEGRNEFTLPFRRLGCRYLQIHIFNFSSPVTMHCLGLRPTEYPLEVKGSFASSDTMLDEIHSISLRTLRLSMAEHFSDCPWREQSLYVGDMRNSAYYTYYALGDYNFSRESLRLLGWGLRDDGLLELCAPARVPITIPGFTAIWISAMRDYYLFSADDTLFHEFKPTIEAILKAFCDRFDEPSGLYCTFEGSQYWPFYEWAPGMDFKDGKTFGDDGTFRLDAPHNILLLEAMTAYADMLDGQQDEKPSRYWRKQAKRLTNAIHRNYWNSKRKLYATFRDRDQIWHYSASTQAMCIANGVAKKQNLRSLQSCLFQPNDLIPMTLAYYFYGIKALEQAPGDIQPQAFKTALSIFRKMVLSGATSLWETLKGSDDFDLAGSLCHSWSAAPLFIFYGFFLGIRPLEPGFKRFLVQPHTAGLPGASGVIPTPHGPIEVAWEKHGNVCNLEIKAPKNLTPEFQLVDDGLTYRVLYNGKPVSP